MCWPAGWMAGWLAGRLPAWLTDWLLDWLTGWLTDCLGLTDWLTDWLTEWLTDWLVIFYLTCLTQERFIGVVIMCPFKLGVIQQLDSFNIKCINIIIIIFAFICVAINAKWRGHALHIFADLFSLHSLSASISHWCQSQYFFSQSACSSLLWAHNTVL